MLVYMAKKAKLVDKLIKEVDDHIWTIFTGWCRGNRIKAGHKLSEIITDFLKKKNIR